MSEPYKDNADSSPKSVRVWMKVEIGGQKFTAEGFGVNLGAANQHALEQVSDLVNAASTATQASAQEL